jgi:hypothetical protein
LRHTRHHHYLLSDVIRAAFLAGSGASADEIADALGGRMTVKRVYGLVRRHGLRLVCRNRDQLTFGPTRVSRSVMAEYERVCEPHGIDPQTIAERVLDEAGKDSARLREIVKGVVEQ